MKVFLRNILNGFAIGIAFVVPGFSGGTIAVILGVYDKLISSITGIFKKFGESVAFLAPIAIGMVIAFVAMYFPIKLGLTYLPLPTICLFVGLMLGGMPQIFEKVKGCGSVNNKVVNVFAFAVALIVAGGIGFLPTEIFSPNLIADVQFMDYLLLFVICMVASCALVVPGISGSMILMIFGYYTPIMYDIIGNLFDNGIQNFVILGVALFGIVCGFFGISFIMKWLLSKFPKATYIAISGFVVGSIITLFYACFAGKFSLSQGVPLIIELSAFQIILSLLLLFVGLAASLMLYLWSISKGKSKINESENGKN